MVLVGQASDRRLHPLTSVITQIQVQAWRSAGGKTPGPELDSVTIPLSCEEIPHGNHLLGTLQAPLRPPGAAQSLGRLPASLSPMATDPTSPTLHLDARTTL